MHNRKLKKAAIFILIIASFAGAIYTNIKIFPPDSIWSWQYWINMINKQ